MRRVSIAGLMVAVCIVAIAIASLKEASEGWTGALLMATLVVLANSLFGIAYRQGATRAAWLGFAIFGFGYLTLSLGPWSGDRFRASLPTSRVLAFAHGRLFPPETYSVVTRVIPAPAGSSGGPMMVRSMELGDATASAPVMGANRPTSIRTILSFPDNFGSFERVGHCLITFLAGLLGALIARWFHRGAAASATSRV